MNGEQIFIKLEEHGIIYSIFDKYDTIVEHLIDRLDEYKKQIEEKDKIIARLLDGEKWST